MKRRPVATPFPAPVRGPCVARPHRGHPLKSANADSRVQAPEPPNPPSSPRLATDHAPERRRRWPRNCAATGPPPRVPLGTQRRPGAQVPRPPPSDVVAIHTVPAQRSSGGPRVRPGETGAGSGRPCVCCRPCRRLLGCPEIRRPHACGAARDPRSAPRRRTPDRSTRSGVRREQRGPSVSSVIPLSVSRPREPS